MNILIIGCGVSGLTTGPCLLKAGHTARIWAKDLPPHTTSNVAAAVWMPFKAYPPEKVTAWGRETFSSISGTEKYLHVSQKKRIQWIWSEGKEKRYVSN